MCSLPKLSALILFICFAATLTDGQQYKNCSNNSLDCPENSLCTRVEEYLKCVCVQSFEWNTKWLNQTTSTNSTQYCLRLNSSNVQEGNKLIMYIRSPARKDHLAFGILLVLLAATLATAVLYLIKILRPLKRSKAVYRKLKMKRQNRHPLQEFDEIDMVRRDTDAQLGEL